MFRSQIQQRTASALNGADADLLLRLGIALSVNKRAGWHLVRVAVQNGVVQLAGVVPTFYDGQLIAALARHVAGVRRVEDQLAVGDPSIRQHVEATDGSYDQPAPSARPTESQNPFAHLPVVSEPLEEILARPAAVASSAK